MLIQTFVHYGFHFVAPLLFAQFYKCERRIKAFWIMIATMFVDLDHLLATPIFDPNRCSIGFHPLHSYIAIGIYLLMCFLPYKRLGLSWWLQPIGVGLVFHMFTDFQDYYFWHSFK